MKLVVLESPYAGNIEENIKYARACIKDCLKRGESPIASHLLYTQEGILDDGIKEDRELGIKAGHAWMRVAEAVIVYQDNGISSGMLEGIKQAKYYNLPIEYRNLIKNN